MNQGEVVVTLRVDNGKLTAGIKNAEGQIQSFTEKAGKSTSSLDDKLNKLGDTFKLAMKAGGIAAVAAGVSSIKMAATFEQSLNVLRYASKATDAQMAQLTAQARKLGNDLTLPGVSAADAAGAMTELAKAGLSVKDTLAASKGVLSLAKAGNIEVADAAGIAASALNAFSLEGRDASKVADMLAAGANASQADLSDLAQGLAQSATVAKQFKLSLNENITALALFANNGIRGSDAGTSLKTMLISLANPSDGAASAMKELGFNAYDASGKFVGLDEMSKRLHKSLSGLTEQQKQAALATIFGTDAFRAAGILADNAGKSYQSMAKNVGEVGAATKAAAAMNAGFLGALDALKSTLETIGTDIGMTTLPTLTALANYISQNLPGALQIAKKTFDKTFGVISKGFQDILGSAQKGDWESVGSKLGSAITTGINAVIDNLGPLLQKGLDKIKGIDWLGVGIKVGREAVPFVIGLAAGIADLDFGKLFDGIKANLGTILLAVLTIALAPAKLIGGLAKIFARIPFVGTFLSAAINWIRIIGQWLLGKAGELGMSFIRGLTGNLTSQLPGFFAFAKQFFMAIPNALASIAGMIWQQANIAIGLLGRAILENGPRPIIQGFGIIRQTIVNAVKDFGSMLFERGSALVRGLLNGFNSMFGATFSNIGNFIAGIIGKFSGASNWLVGAGHRVVTGLRDGAINVMGGVLNWFGGIGGRIGKAVGNTYKFLWDAGKWIVWGLKDGMMSVIGSIEKVAGNIADTVKNKVKSLLGIHSPSRVFMEIGSYTMQGFANGIAKNAGLVTGAMTAATAGLSSSVSSFSSPTLSGSMSFDAYAGRTTSANQSQGTGVKEIKQYNTINTPLDMNVVNRSLAREINR